MIVGNGRPLRFLGMVGGGWVALRVAIVWQATGSLPEAVRGILPLPEQAIAAVDPALGTVADPVVRRAGARELVSVRTPKAALAIATPPVATASAVDPVRVQLALLAMTRFAGDLGPDVQSAIGAGLPTGATLPTLRARPAESLPAASRFSVSSWMIARGGGGIGASALSPQLGGTQGGVRVDYALGHGLAATTRVAAPAAGAGREVSLGIAWRPSSLPLRFVAEQRVALDSGKGGPALGLSGGVSEVQLPAGFRLEGYGQAGAIFRNGIERYVDGSVRAARPIGRIGAVALDIGGGGWGGAQRGVARVDVGPSVGARVPIVDRQLRLSVDWRHRIAGNARPGSGPAVTLGTDF